MIEALLRQYGIYGTYINITKAQYSMTNPIKSLKRCRNGTALQSILGLYAAVYSVDIL